MSINQNRNQQSVFPRPPGPVPNVPCREMYTIKPGDTLYAISTHYGVPVSVLMQVNSIPNPYSLRIGQQICIPGNVNPSAEPVETTPSCPGILHTIVAGDTLYMISKKHKVPLDALMNANPNIDPYNLRIGTKICVPLHGMQPAPEMPFVSPAAPVTPGTEPSVMPPVTPPSMPPVTPPSMPPVTPPSMAPVTPPSMPETIPPIMPTMPPRQTVPMTPGLPKIPTGPGAPMCPFREPEEMSMGTYHVKIGDNLDNICQRLNMPMQNVMKANPILCVMDFSIPGTRINVPR